MADETIKTTVTDDTSKTHKISMAILGAIVVILLVLIFLSLARFIRNRISVPTATLPTTSSSVTNNAVVNLPVLYGNTSSSSATNTASYSAYPSTGPTETSFILFLGLAVLGSTTLVLSKRFA